MQTRRSFLAAGAGVAASRKAIRLIADDGSGQESRTLREAGAADVEVLLPCDRVPLSFVIDDSTCLVNMGHFCTPQWRCQLVPSTRSLGGVGREKYQMTLYAASGSGVRSVEFVENTVLCPTLLASVG